MIKLKDILFEDKSPDIFIPRRTEDRVERVVKEYIRNGSVGELSLKEMDLTELPEILKGITVNGIFDCMFNRLTTLKNSPKIVTGTFYCSYNRLISVEGAPEFVGGNFYCLGNINLNITKEDVRAVCKVKGAIRIG